MTWLIALCCVAIAPTTFAQMASHSASCKIDTTKPSDADIAFYHGDLIKSAKLYADALQANPADERSHELWIDSLIGRGKLDEASKNIEEWTLAAPKSARAITTASEVRHAEGDWLEAYALALKSIQIDPCIPDTYEDMAKYETLAGYHATARKHLSVAHQLAPNNESIRLEWISSLDRDNLRSQLKSFIETSTSISEASRKRLEARVDSNAALGENKCELVSAKGPFVIPMVPIVEEHQAGVAHYSLEVALNGHKRLLQIDTGASGFLLTRSGDSGTGLSKVDTARVGGFGSQGSNGIQIETAKTVQIGGLEFKNCIVESLEATGVMGGESMGMGDRLDSGDGLVGTDIFARYLVTVDYVKHEIRLEPLPPSPAEADAPRDPLGGINDPGAIIADRVVPASLKSWTSLYREGHMLLLPARVNSKPSRLFVLDTGSFTDIIDKKFATEVSTYRTGINGVQGLSGVSVLGEAGHFTVDFANIRLPVQSMDSLDLSRFGASGFLGYPTLQQLVMHIDYRDNLILMEAPNAHKL